MEPANLCQINVYCDESRHTSNPNDPFLVIGAVACLRNEKTRIVRQIHLLRKQYRAYGEIGWKRLSPNRESFYMSLVDLFAREQSLSFRCIVVDRNILDHQLYNDGDEELGFYKLYYQMLVHWLMPSCAYRIYLDWQMNREQHRFMDLKIILQRKLSGKALIECLEPVASGNQPLIWLCDLFAGAVGYSWNDRSESAIKLRFCRELAHAGGIHRLNVATGLHAHKFNIFHFTGKRNG